jgi:hypothetical protein
VRFSRLGSLVFLLLLSVPGWAQQTTGTQTSPQPASDPQAVAVVQAAITALGGTTAIGQSQAWQFQGQLDGPIESGSKTETIKLRILSPTVVVRGITRLAPKHLGPSLFLPILAGAVLLQQAQDSNYEIRLDSPSTLAGRPVNTIKFVYATSGTLAQVWTFDATTNLPVRILFESSAVVAQTQSIRGVVELSNYTTTSGVQYPSTVVTRMEGSSPETLQLQSVTPFEDGQATGGAR